MDFLFTVYQPAPELRHFVHSFTHLAPIRENLENRVECRSDRSIGALAFPLADGDPLIDRLLPSVCSSFSFNLGDPFTLALAGRVAPVKERSHVLGSILRPGRMQLPLRTEFLDVSFNPGFAHHFLGAPANELNDQFLALEHFWGKEARRLEQRLLDSSSVVEKIRQVETMLRGRMTLTDRDRGMPALADRIYRGRGLMTVEQISAESGWSRQHLARRFRQSLGVNPKLYCRLVRFQHTLSRVLMAPRSSWALAALELGYSDQPHLITEFKAFTGCTPTQFAALR